MLVNLAQVLTGGLLLGGIYALAALGLSISLGVLNVLNVAHGDFLMLGALASYWLFVVFKVNPFIATFIVIPVFFVVGLLFQRVLIRPIAAKPPHELLIGSILVTLGASMAMEDSAAFIWGTDIKGIAYSLPSLKVAGVIVPSLRLGVLVFIGVITLAVHLFLKGTFTGRAVRAITQEREGAMIVGVNIPWISMIAFGLGVSLASAAGAFYATIFTIYPFIGIPLTLKYLVIVILGGLGSVGGTLAAGAILGVAETTTALYLGPDWAPAVSFITLIVILLIRPEGLFGKG